MYFGGILERSRSWARTGMVKTARPTAATSGATFGLVMVDMGQFVYLTQSPKRLPEYFIVIAMDWPFCVMFMIIAPV